MMLAWVDGRIVDAAAARVPLLDRGHLLGDGVFETLRVQRGRPFRLSAHLDRLGEGIRVLGLGARPVEAAADAVHALAAAVGAKPHLVRVQVTSGDFVDVDAGAAPRVTATARPLTAPRSVRLVTASLVKRTTDPLCGIKHTSFLPHLLARRAARAAGADDAVMLNEHGDVAEATTSNIMALADGVVHAPGRAAGALDGVTRAVVLEALARDGARVETSLPRKTLARATEVWLTNTSGGCVPVTHLDGRPVPAGPVASRLHAAVLAAVEEATRG